MRAAHLRAAYVAIVAAITFGAGVGCGPFETPAPPPPTKKPPNVKTYTLELYIHELLSSPGQIVKHSPLQVKKAPEVWDKCAISMVISNFVTDGLFGPDPSNNDNTVWFGEKFPATKADGSTHNDNWTKIESAAYKKFQSTEKGSDNHYTKAIFQKKGCCWVNTAGGITITSTADQGYNFSVNKPLQADLGQQLILAHEIGHQLGLPHLLEQGNLMCEETGCGGTTIKGSIGHPDALAPGTQCAVARDVGDKFDFFNNT
jgi:hypothetical protein